MFYLLGSIAALMYIYINMSQPKTEAGKVVTLFAPPLWRRRYGDRRYKRWKQQREIEKLQKQVAKLQEKETTTT